MAIQGIDVSYAQGNIDWAKVKASGVAFAMIRACYGWDDDSQIDRYFRANVQGCEAVGMPYGLYHYSYAQTPEDAQKEAKFFLRVIDGCRPEYPVVFDLEDSSQQKLGKSTLTDIAKAFLSTVEKAGYYAMLYANKYWLTGLLDMSRLSNYDVWLAPMVLRADLQRKLWHVAVQRVGQRAGDQRRGGSGLCLSGLPLYH